MYTFSHRTAKSHRKESPYNKRDYIPTPIFLHFTLVPLEKEGVAIIAKLTMTRWIYSHQQKHGNRCRPTTMVPTMLRRETTQKRADSMPLSI